MFWFVDFIFSMLVSNTYCSVVVGFACLDSSVHNDGSFSGVYVHCPVSIYNVYLKQSCYFRKTWFKKKISMPFGKKKKPVSDIRKGKLKTVMIGEQFQHLTSSPLTNKTIPWHVMLQTPATASDRHKTWWGY